MECSGFFNRQPVPFIGDAAFDDSIEESGGFRIVERGDGHNRFFEDLYFDGYGTAVAGYVGCKTGCVDYNGVAGHGAGGCGVVVSGFTGCMAE